MSVKNEHLSVCICTYKRPKMLERLLEKLRNQTTENQFIYSIVIVDNDKNETAKEVVEKFRKSTDLDVTYVMVPENNFALVRNTTIKNAKGNYIAFIDDDEFPVENWLLLNYRTLKKNQAAGSLGPVLPYFEIKPPKWIVKGKVCERKRFPTGTVLNWNNTRTGNVLLDKSLFQSESDYFDMSFGKLGGEDVDFFRRMMAKGHQFVACDEAIAYEEVPAERLTASYYLKRAYLRGNISYNYYKNEMTFGRKLKMFLKSAVAMAGYSLLFPVLLIAGFHHFMKFLIKFNDHYGRVMTILGLYKTDKRNI